MQQYETQFLFSLFLTVAVETAVLFILLRKLAKVQAKKVPGAQIVFSGVLASAATLPYVWFVLPAFFGSFQSFVLVSELFAVVAETVMYFFLLRQGLKTSFLLSLACNAASFLLGLAIGRII